MLMYEYFLAVTIHGVKCDLFFSCVVAAIIFIYVTLLFSNTSKNILKNLRNFFSDTYKSESEYFNFLVTL